MLYNCFCLQSNHSREILITIYNISYLLNGADRWSL